MVLGTSLSPVRDLQQMSAALPSCPQPATIAVESWVVVMPSDNGNYSIISTI